MGSWHVLVHYRDAGLDDPEQVHWDDRIWVFEREGGRLRWTEFPIVIFRDRSGRFAPAGAGRERRLPGPWQPNQAQAVELRTGLAVAEHGRRSKSLVADGEARFGTRARAAPASASSITYTEVWSVDAAGGLPVFRQEDRMGSARTDPVAGLAVWTSERVGEGGEELSGRFERDGIRRGSFRMRRTGPVRSAPGRARVE